MCMVSASFNDIYECPCLHMFIMSTNVHGKLTNVHGLYECSFCH